MKYGERAMVYMQAHGTAVSLTVVAVLAAGFGAYLLWNRSNADTI